MKAIDCRRGMKVRFGRLNGEHTLGEVIKLNPTRAKIRTLEERGRGRGGQVGRIWNVPYSMMTPAAGETSPPVRHGSFGGYPPGFPIKQETPVGKARLTLDVTVGEYRVIFGPKTTLQAYRHGVEWRKMDGDNLVLALVQEVEDQRRRIVELENTLFHSQPRT